MMDRVTWTPTSYAAQLASADIALARLHDDPFARGKCAYKLLQGMAAVRTHHSFDAWAGVWRKAVLS
jgi:hypothetical protein